MPPRGLIDPSLLTGIANAIRAKTGSSSALSPVQMAAAIAGIQGGVWQNSDIPAYVKTEAAAVIARVKAKMTSDSILFLAISDAHQDDETEAITHGNQHAGMAAKAISYALPLDFACLLGDSTVGAANTPTETVLKNLSDVSRYVSDAFEGLVQFRCPGNHDSGGYGYTANGSSLTQAQIYPYYGKHNADCGNTMGSTSAGYCYRDFDTQKLRVVCLNTAEVDNPTGDAFNVSAAQRAWFANLLMAHPQNYGLLILSHHPLDWAGSMTCSEILRACWERSSITIDGISYNYSSNNIYKPSYAFQIHGHTHNYLMDHLHYNNSGIGTAYDLYRMAVPNACFTRSNEYGQNNGAEYYFIEFGTTETYTKTASSGKDTALCVFVINPTDQMVYSIAYGAGVDRELYFGENTVAVTGVNLSASSGSLHPGETVTLTATVAPSNASNTAISWSTSNASVATVSGGVVTAVGVGSAAITATTQDGGYTATYSLTVEAVQLGNLRDAIGYADGVRLSTSTGAESAQNGYVTVQYIDVAQYFAGGQCVIRAKGATFNAASAGYAAYAFYNASKAKTATGYLNAVTTGQFTIAFDGDVLVYTMLVNADNLRYLRICGQGSGTDLDIRINENFQ